MILYTGDIHGDVTGVVDMIYAYSLKKDDVIVLLGDVGINFYMDNRDTDSKNYLNKALEESGAKVLCIHGNHEERPYNIPTYNKINWREGIVYVEDAYKNILFAKDGEIYNLENKMSIAIGGAYSVDKKWRLENGYPWFKDEQPSEDVKKYVEKQLESVNWTVDQVLSHTCPIKYTPVDRLMKGLDQSTVDRSTEFWLDSIEDKLKYTRWLCGHWHIDRVMGKLRFLMNDYIM